MSTLSRQTEWDTGDVLTADALNDEFDNIVNDYNGSITNANISASAAIAISKLATINESSVTFSGTSGQYVTSDGDGTLTWASLTFNRAFTWYIPGTLATRNEQGGKWVAPQNLTVTNLRAITGTGTATVRIQTGTTDIDSGSSVTTTVSNDTSFASTSISAGDVITLDITAASGTNLSATLECTQ